MHQLHLVGFTADHDGLIFSTKRGATAGDYVVGVDDALFSALEEARRMAMADPDEAARAAADRVKALRATQRSSLPVRDIQSRLRAGMSLADVAKEAGVDEEWVGRFAAPVLAEQAAVVDKATMLTFTTARKGPSSQPLGDSVRWNLADRSIPVDASPQAAGWSAFQLEPGQWAVRFTYSSRGRQQVAEWEVDLDAGELTARNRPASVLAFVEAGARRRAQPEPAPAPAPAPKKATTGRRGRPARTETARAQAANATSSKAAATRATSAKAASEARKRAAPPAAADSRKRAAQPAPPATAKRAGGGSGSGETAPASSDRQPASTGGSARFPAPRPASARPGGATPSGSEPRGRPRPSSQAAPRRPSPAPAPAPPVARQASPPPVQPRPTTRRTPPPPPPIPQPLAGRQAPERAARPAPPSNLRSVPPPEAWPMPAEPTADARPLTLVEAPAPPPGDVRPLTAVAPPLEPMPLGAPAPAPAVRRLPSPSAAATSRRAEQEITANPTDPAPSAEIPIPVPTPIPEPEPEPIQPRPAPANVRPVGGRDGRPTILIIDAERAGDRRQS